MQNKAHNIQTIVEEPYVYLFALNSSAIEDQAGLIADRVECLSGLNDPLIASKPLHNLKGHLINLFSELPSALPSCIKAECTQRIKKCLSRGKKKAAELRATVIQLYHITNVMLGMQAKQIGTTKANGATIVTKTAKGIPKYPGTHIPIEFVNAHKDSWQAHLEKISPFMITWRDSLVDRNRK